MTFLGRRSAALSAVLGICLVAAACSRGSSGKSSGGDITVGVFADQTSYLANADGGVITGAKLAADAINADGGVLGKHVKVVVDDTAADPQKSVTAAQKLITQSHSAALIGGFSSSSTNAVAPVAARSKVPMVVASIPAQDPAWTFSTLPPGKFQVDAMIGYLKAKNIDSVGLIRDTTPYNAGLVQTAKPALEAAGIHVVGVEQHTADAIDLRPQVTSLLSSKPGAILKFSTGPTEIVAAKALAQAGAKIPLIVAQDTIAIVKQATAAYPQVFMVSAAPQVYSVLPSDKKTDALTHLMSTYKGSSDPTYVGRGWDAMYILANAIKAAGKVDGSAIKDKIASEANYAGTTGSYSFAGPSHFGITTNPFVLAAFDNTNVQIVGSPASG